jgi:hypothetical protein
MTPFVDVFPVQDNWRHNKPPILDELDNTDSFAVSLRGKIVGVYLAKDRISVPTHLGGCVEVAAGLCWDNR